MSITIRDPELLGRITAKRGSVEIQDGAGETVGRFLTTWPTPLPVPLGSGDRFLERVTDLTLLAAFARVEQPVLVFDPDGELVGQFERTWYGMPEKALHLRLEECRRAARNQKGHTLAEVWKIIHEKYVGDEFEPIIVEALPPTG